MLLDFNHWTLRNPERGRDLLDVFSKEELLALLVSYALSDDSRFADARTPLPHGSDKHDSTVCAANDPRLLTTLDSRSRVFSSFLPNVATALTLTNGTAYFVYLGRTVAALTPKHVEFYASTAGSGAQTAEAGFFSSPNSPNKGAQTLTKLVSTGTLDSLTSEAQHVGLCDIGSGRNAFVGRPSHRHGHRSTRHFRPLHGLQPGTCPINGFFRRAHRRRPMDRRNRGSPCLPEHGCVSGLERSVGLNLEVFTVATDRNTGFTRFDASLTRFAVAPTVLGTGEMFHGYAWRFKKLVRAVRDSVATVILFADAYDTLCLESPSLALEKFAAFNHPIVFSFEPQSQPEPYLALNAGLMIANREAFLDVFTDKVLEALFPDHFNDQLQLQAMLSWQPDLFRLDRNSEIFFTSLSGASIPAGRTPTFIHAPYGGAFPDSLTPDLRNVVLGENDDLAGGG